MKCIYTSTFDQDLQLTVKGNNINNRRIHFHDLFERKQYFYEQQFFVNLQRQPFDLQKNKKTKYALN